jgi:hypothetical protein
MQKLTEPFLCSIENVGSLYNRWDRAKRFRANNVIINAEMGKQTFLKVCKSQIRKFLGLFRNRKFANFLGKPVRKSQKSKFFINPQIANPQIATKY